MSDSNFDFIELLEDLKEDYIQAFPKQSEDVRKLIGYLKQNPADKNLRKQLHRKVHSIKGSSGSCNLQFLSTLFRRFEMFLLDSFEAHVETFAPQAPLEFLLLVENFLKSNYEDEKEQESINQKIKELFFKALNRPESFEASEVGEILGVNSSKFEKKSLKEIIERHPYHITWVDNEVDLFSQILNHHYSHIILPHYLTKVDAIEFSRALNQLTIFSKETKIIIVTSDDISEPIDIPNLTLIKKDGDFKDNLNHLL